ncbi:hypothetical protein ACJ73_08797 [Blastomyces percursus]|uniref:Uncharacterized protein n=1 Tax=Blastomyces percursus TaxID=1658174 RepID=A0A1J9QQC1_9EURO|nr:hypothetical protein ACJ73_08797 [Blastomyces percursus]
MDSDTFTPKGLPSSDKLQNRWLRTSALRFLPRYARIIRLGEHRVLKSAIPKTGAMNLVAANTTIYETRWSGNRTDASQIVTEYLDKVWGKHA